MSWYQIVVYALCFVCYVISVFFIRKTGKRNRALADLVDIAAIVQKIPDYVNQAESMFGAERGAAKLSYVLQCLQLACLESGVSFEAYREELSNEVEAVLSTPQKKTC